MVYEVNENKKNEVIAKIKIKRSDRIKIPYIVYEIGRIVSFLVFSVFAIISIGFAVNLYNNGYKSDAIAALTLILLGGAVSLLLMIIPASIRSSAIRKYLMPWVSKKEEHVLLTEKAVEHEFYNKFWGEYYYTLKVKYHDVVRIEYDEEQSLLRVYGPTEQCWWTSVDKSICHDKFPADYQNKEGNWIEIPTYFENFEGLKKELEEKSGKVIENKSRPFLKYK